MLNRINTKLQLLGELFCEVNDLKFNDFYPNYNQDTKQHEIYIRTPHPWNKTFINTNTGMILEQETVFYEGHAGGTILFKVIKEAKFSSFFVKKFKEYNKIKDQLEELNGKI